MMALMRTIGLAGTWAFIYALPALPIEGLANLGISFSFTNAVDMWPMELGLPGLIGGVLFAVLLALTGRLGRFETLSALRLAGLGALAGALVGGIYLATVWPEPAQSIALILGLAIGLGTVAGPGSALAFRVFARRGQASTARSGAGVCWCSGSRRWR